VLSFIDSPRYFQPYDMTYHINHTLTALRYLTWLTSPAVPTTTTVTINGIKRTKAVGEVELPATSLLPHVTESLIHIYTARLVPK
jgi:hypothetical protein